MSFFSQIHAGIYDAVYSYKLARFRRHISKNRKQIEQQQVRQPKGGVLNIAKVKRILIIKNEAFGDMILVTPLIRNLKLNGYQVDVMASQANRVLIEHNPYVDHIITQLHGPEYANQFVQEQMKDAHYDLVMDLRYPIYYEDLDRLLFPQHIPCDFLLGWNRSNIGIYDDSINCYNQAGHFVGVVNAFLEYMGIQGADLSYDIFTTPEAGEAGLYYVRDLWRKGGPVVVFNAFSSHTSRDLSTEQISQTIDKILVNYPFAQIVLIGLPDKVSQIQIDPLKKNHISAYVSPDIMDVVPLIQYADVVISPDTSIVHIAATFQKPTIGLYISAIRESSDGKEKAKQSYYKNMQLLKDRFFDEPRITAGLREEKSLLNDFMFAPNNEKSAQLFSNTGDITDLPSDYIADVFGVLVARYVRDAKYVSTIRQVPQVTHEVQFPNASSSKDKPQPEAEDVDFEEITAAKEVTEVAEKEILEGNKYGRG